MIKDEPKVEDVVSIVPEVTVEQKSLETILEPIKKPPVNEYTSFIKDGVEVVDVKLILKDKERKVDKFGIPILPGEHRNFDKI
jgi:hypothetical protein